MKLNQGASKSTKRYIIDGIKYVCENFKERSPGSYSERKAQKYLKNELEQFADEVEMEDFEVHPAAFMGWIPAAGILSIISVILFWITYTKNYTTPAIALVSLIITLFSTLCLIFEFLLYRPFVDFLFPKKISRNVFARRKSSGETKKRIIFGGHTDAANEWTYSFHGGIKTLAPVMAGAVSGLIFITLFDLVWTVYAFAAPHAVDFEQMLYNSNWWLVFGIIQLLFVPFFIAILFFINWGVVVDGANDNLTADYIAMAVLKEMKDRDIRLENTEVCALLSGSEEAGLRGALAYAKRHCEEWQNEYVETIFVAMDTMHEIDRLQLYTRGCTGTQKNSNAVAELMYEAGQKCGLDLKETNIYPGAVDAEAFSRVTHNMVESVGFCGVNHNPKTYYHTRMDTADNINEECIFNALDVCLEAAQLYDDVENIDHFRLKGNERFKKGAPYGDTRAYKG